MTCVQPSSTQPNTQAPNKQPISQRPHHDWMFYVLYHEDISFLKGIITSSVKNISQGYSWGECAELKNALEWFADVHLDSLSMLRAKLFFLLDRDEKTRREFTVYESGTCRLRSPFPPEKADRFYPALHETVIPHWISNETFSLDSLIGNIREAYLIS
jgi:hypothetical protein